MRESYPMGRLVEYETGRVVRPASAADHSATKRAPLRDGDKMLIFTEGRICYVEQERVAEAV